MKESKWYILPSGLAIILLSLLIGNQVFRYQIQSLQLVSNPAPDFQQSLYPSLDSSGITDISAQAFAVMDKDSHVIFFSKNPMVRFSPASTTKLMSVLVANQYFKPDDILSVKHVIDTQGSGLGLLLGERITFQNLLYAMLLPSANDAAFTVAQNYQGGVANFVTVMNVKARQLYLFNTHYGDPAGLDDDNDFSTATDLVHLADIFMKQQNLKKIVGISYATITDASGVYTYQIKNRNILLGQLGINGIKTGYTDQAGEVLVTSAKHNGHQLFAVVMASNNRFTDTQKLLTFIYQHLQYLSTGQLLH